MRRKHKPKINRNRHLSRSRAAATTATARFLEAGKSANRNSPTWPIGHLNRLSPARTGQVNTIRNQ